MRRLATRPAMASAVLALAALTLAACSDDSSDDGDASSETETTSPTSSAPTQTEPTTTPAPSSPAGGGVTLTVGGLPDFPDALTDAEGLAVYVFTTDQAGASQCEGSCAQNWPPVETTGAPTVEGGGAEAGQQARPDGTSQATYGGWPLYYFVQDTAPGQANGPGITAFGGTFLLINSAGQPIGG